MTRSEQEIFGDLKVLAAEPGFEHVLAAFCFRDNVIRYGEVLDADATQNQYSDEHLVRTEISTLLGLAVRGGQLRGDTKPPPNLEDLIRRAEELLHQLHLSLLEPTNAFFKEAFAKGSSPENLPNPFERADVLREAIFYGGESAYMFQYRDFAPIKYARDSDWLVTTKGVDSAQAGAFLKEFCRFQNDRLLTTLKSLRKKPVSEWSMLGAFVFDREELLTLSCGLSRSEIACVLDAFSLPTGDTNPSFSSLSEYNAVNAYPIVRLDDDKLLILIQYSLAEAMYDTPFYWMMADSGYRDQATENRGVFTELIAHERLSAVFGKDNVYSNVEIQGAKGETLGEIDVLVRYADNYIVIQAKSKKLTIEARKGNDRAIRKDYKQAVQDAYDQALLCSELIVAGKGTLVARGGAKVAVMKPQRVVPVCVVADHYPALAFQSRQFLKYRTTEIIRPPFVMDVFLLDLMAEMLETPLYFFSYLLKRTEYIERVNATHELTVLSYHLRRNLWLERSTDFLHLHDDVSSALDVAVLVRREGLPGNPVIEGLATVTKRGAVGDLIRRLERSPEPAQVDLGLLLLTVGEDTLNQINRGLGIIREQNLNDGKKHDFSISIEGGGGLTIHCTDTPSEIAVPALLRHCELRKYAQRSPAWFGILAAPDTLKPRAGFELRGEWVQSPEMDAATADLPKGRARVSAGGNVFARPGRNDPCWCGSGKKYKKCHLDQDETKHRR